MGNDISRHGKRQIDRAKSQEYVGIFNAVVVIATYVHMYLSRGLTFDVVLFKLPIRDLGLLLNRAHMGMFSL